MFDDRVIVKKEMSGQRMRLETNNWSRSSECPFHISEIDNELEGSGFF